MILLGIETATERLSAVILSDGKVYKRYTDTRSSHCELLTGFIEELVSEAGIVIGSLEGVAVSIGPGSFTGLRIGIATAMGLAFGLGIRAAGINTLSALAWNIAEPGMLVCPMIDAKRSEAYTAVYRSTGDSFPETVVEPGAIPVAKLADTLKAFNEPLLITGPAAHNFRDKIETVGSQLMFVSPGDGKPSAEAVARIGAIMFEQGKAVSPDALKPQYLRRSDAELCKKNGIAGRKSFS